MRPPQEFLESFRLMRPHLRGCRGLAFSCLLSALIATALEGFGVGMLVPLLSLLLGGEGATPMRPISWLRETIPGQPAPFYVLSFCALILAAIAAKNGALISSQWLAARMRRIIGCRVRETLFAKIQRCDVTVIEQHKGGELTGVLLNETERLRALVDHGLLFLQRVSMGVFYLVMLTAISWQITFLCLGLGILLGVVLRWSYRLLQKRGESFVETNMRLSAAAHEALASLRFTRSTNTLKLQVARFNPISLRQGVEEEGVTRVNQMIPAVAETFSVGGAMLIIGWAYFSLVKPGLLLPSYLLGFGFILLRLLPIASGLYGLYGHVLYLMGSLKEVSKWLSYPEHPDRPFGDVAVSAIREAISFEGVSYIYPGTQAGIRSISFTIRAGTTVALVGRSGSGKSTIASLLLRLRGPNSGIIRVDGTDYWDISPESWHGMVASVDQDTFLFHDSFRNNILHAAPAATEEQVQKAVRMARLDEVIAGLPKGMDTIIGDRGTTLSGGQRQRLAIARALIRNPSLLILDEATSALDNISERLVQEAIHEAMVGRTVVVIAHRLSTIRTADQILLLEAGGISASGTWEELIQVSDTFREMISHREKV